MGVLSTKLYSQRRGDFKKLIGTLWYRGNFIQNPIVNNRSKQMESDDTFDRPQANLLGLKAIQALGIIIDLSDISIVEDLAVQQQEQEVMMKIQEYMEQVLDHMKRLQKAKEYMKKLQQVEGPWKRLAITYNRSYSYS